MHSLARMAIDVVAVGVFAAVGRSSHHETTNLLGIAQTAAPFWLGLGAGWSAVLLGAKKTWLGEGLAVYLSTLVVGHLARLVLGTGSAVAFFIVSAVALAVFLVGWRAVAALVGRRRAA